MKALLVVDIHDYFGWSAEQIENNETKKRIALAIKNELQKARAAGYIVVYAMWPNCSGDGQKFQISKNGKCIGCDNSDPLAEFLEHRHESEAVFYKNAGDAFCNNNLAGYLRTKGITEIVLSGCHTFQCVQSTAIGARKAGFNVTLLRDCAYPPFDDKDKYINEARWIEDVRNCATLSKSSNFVQAQ